MVLEKERRGFLKGWGHVTNKDSKKLMNEILDGMGIQKDRRSGWFRLKNGMTSLSNVEADFIEKKFKKYHVTDIWDK